MALVSAGATGGSLALPPGTRGTTSTIQADVGPRRRLRCSSGRCATGANASTRPTSKDRNGRLLARVWCSGIDANAEQVRRGMAWVLTATSRIGACTHCKTLRDPPG
jgi:hypothetical protein